MKDTKVAVSQIVEGVVTIELSARFSSEAALNHVGAGLDVDESEVLTVLSVRLAEKIAALLHQATVGASLCLLNTSEDLLQRESVKAVAR